MVFLISNTKDSGQYYYDGKNGIVYRCRFRRPAPGMEIAPCSWVQAMSAFVSFFLLLFFFTKPYVSLLFNVCTFGLELCLSMRYMGKKRVQVEKAGVAYVLRDLNEVELKDLKRDVYRGSGVYYGLYYHFYNGAVMALLLLAVIFSYGKQFVLALNFLLYAIELWGYNFFFTRRKHQKNVLNEIELRLSQLKNID